MLRRHLITGTSSFVIGLWLGSKLGVATESEVDNGTIATNDRTTSEDEPVSDSNQDSDTVLIDIVLTD
jgi:hypothetical protein